MRVLTSWLKEFVDFTLSPDQLADTLTRIGLEVESCEEIKRDFSRVVSGQVISCESHPSAEKLSICQVTTGGGRPYRVVCGAPNVAVGIIAPFALPEAKLQGHDVHVRDIRGIQSEGMLCSEAELGLTERAEGLMILPSDTALGKDVQLLLGEPDYVLDISVTPNRPDCLSVVGIAREIAAVTGAKLKKPAIKVRGSATSLMNTISVTIADHAHCFRYSGRMLQNVQITSSPFWMAYRLHHSGMRAINNIVDITNYVMLELGHPLHAFDYRQIEKQKIIVRAAKKGETFITLDGKEHELDPDTCLICDGLKPIALAGIMGGLNSEVQADTHSVFLESAYFEPNNIRRTAKRLQISTESSRRFERGADPNGTLPALHRAAQLMVQLANAKIVGQVIDVNRHPIKPKQLQLSIKRCNSLLGTNLTLKAVQQLLSPLEIACKRKNADTLTLTVPTFRPDLTREVDIIEEVARMYGYDNIPFAYAAKIDQRQTANEQILFADQVRVILAGMGLDETLSLSLVSREHAELFLPSNAKAIDLINPLSSDWAFYRTSLLISLLNNVAYNRNRQMQNLKFFELGNIAWYEAATQQVVEKKQIAGLLCGKKNDAVWYAKPEEIDFYDIKGIVLGLLSKLGIKSYQLHPLTDTIWAQESAAISCNGTDRFGVFGKINPTVVSNFKIKVADIYAFVLDFELLFKHRQLEKTFTEIPRFPYVPFDLAFLVDANIAVGDVEREIRRAGGNYLQSVQLFDFYQGEQIPAGKKSIAFSLTFSSKERTLLESEVNAAVANIVNHLKTQFAAELRPR